MRSLDSRRHFFFPRVPKVPSFSRYPFYCICILAFQVLSSGCSSSGPPKIEQTAESNLKNIYVLFGQYSGKNQGKAPPDEATFKAFVQKLEPERLEEMAVPSADSLFISPRDKEPFTLYYNRQSTMPGVGQAGILAHEKTGVDGKRWVLLTTGEIEEVDQSRFDELVQKK